MHKALLITMVVLFACSCIDTPPDDIDKVTYYMDQEFKDYIIFNVGSYWVYEDTTKKNIDSIYLYKSDIIIEPIARGDVDSAEAYTQHLSSSFYNDTILGGGGARYKRTGQPCYYSEKYLSNFLIVNIQFFSDKPVDYIFEYNQYIKTAYLAYHDSLKLGDKWFYSVKVFENQYKEADLQPRIIYYAKNIGVIKKEMYDGTIWQLKKYKIN